MILDDPDGLDALPDAVVVVDTELVVRAANSLAARLAGRPAGDVIGRDVAEVLPLRDADGSDWWRCGARPGSDPTVATRIPERVVALATPTGTSRSVAVTGRRLRGTGSGERLLVIALRRADRRDAPADTQSEVISTASHELRAPLTSVRGFTKTLLARWDRFDDATRRQMIATIDEDADRVTRLLGELLDVSRVDTGRLPLHRRIVALSTVVAPLAERFTIEHPDRTLRVDVPDGLPELMVDPDRVGQVVANLLDNAVKYGTGDVLISAWTEGDEVCCAVRDEGGGIPARHLDRLFAKYYRGERTSPAGSGLGLYISRGIVDAHGGRIWARSAPADGTTFVFALPTAAAQLSVEVDGDAVDSDSGRR